MARKKWRTVALNGTNVSICRSSPSQQHAYFWVSQQPAGSRFEVQYDEGLGGGWENFATVVSVGDGTTDEE
jgi:hypothetical protein